MRAEVIAIGDELTSGQRLNTNSQWISQRLSELGVATLFHTTVGDDLQANVSALQIAAARAELVICTGGLGPTQDDLTRQAIAEAFGCPLALDPASLEKIRELFATRDREMPERNIIQAMFPEGSHVVPNAHGSAPGIDLTVAANSERAKPSRIIALPGVPAEMVRMWHDSVAHDIESMIHDDAGPWHFHSVKVFGIGESDVEVKLPELIVRERRPTVGINVSRATITLRIAARARDPQDFQVLIEPTLAEIRTALGDLIFGEGDEELEHAVLKRLKIKSKCLACIEIGAASWINNWLLAADTDTEAVQADNTPAFAGGITLPSLRQANQWLDSEPSAVPESEHVWKELAIQACQRFQSDISLVVGVYPSLRAMETAQHAFEFIFACAIDGIASVHRQRMGGHPDVLGPRAAKAALDFLLRQI